MDVNFKVETKQWNRKPILKEWVVLESGSLGAFKFQLSNFFICMTKDKYSSLPLFPHL